MDMINKGKGWAAFVRANFFGRKKLILNKHWIIARLLQLVGLRKKAQRPWRALARPAQLPPHGHWRVWLICVGRGWGKSWTGANWLAEQAATYPNTTWAIVGPTWRDTKQICMKTVLDALLPGELKYVNHADLTAVLNNGSRILGYSGDRPDRLRGWTRFNGAWVDELAVMPKAAGLWELLTRATAEGRIVITTTPRALPVLLDISKDPDTHVTHGPTWENTNLSAAAIIELRARYKDTPLAAQELEGELG